MSELAVPTLETARLRLEPLSMAHSGGMFALWREPQVCEHSGDAIDADGRAIALPAASAADSDRLIAFWLDRVTKGTGFRWAVVQQSDEAFVGAIGFNALGDEAELAYHVVPQHQGRGLAAEACRGALDWVFERGTAQVVAFVEDANAPSIRLAKRLGFRRSANGPESETPRYELVRSAWDESSRSSRTMSRPPSE